MLNIWLTLLVLLSPLAVLCDNTMMCCFIDVTSQNKKGPCTKDQYDHHHDIIAGWTKGCTKQACGTLRIGSGNVYSEYYSCPRVPRESAFGRFVGDCYIQCIDADAFSQVCPTVPQGSFYSPFLFDHDLTSFRQVLDERGTCGLKQNV
ncbi:uncharacterized protein SETTUDRAFT_34872 [Exserohilum turcica Et28A]|uniref:Uncharacterized protein n=1 Tax=Exserohilum turcicum (strain 28A) TaxID=671987 RepID=R0JXD9_EXST2|nr:uncharacterized protein SETTUDRAFT_34872 [Exserohilum turcica Et28A]EOA82129.1 hypothetical protein SETTUDRAFT_34872 [Exserohilum turcica Et28A]